MKSKLVLIASLVFLLVLASCAPGPNELADTFNTSGVIAGFWRGLWHGLISPITFVVSLFTDRVEMYEVHNSGGWYNLGFILGAMTAFGGGGAKCTSRRGRPRCGFTFPIGNARARQVTRP